MKSRSQIRNMVFSGIMVALGILLPFAFHAVPNGGTIFLPMHLPVMVAGFFLPWYWALAVGAVTPLLSSLLTGMPPMAPVPMVVIMAFELAAYAVAIAFVKDRLVSPRRWYSPLLALVPAMVAGRAVSGLVVWVLVGLVGIQMKSPWLFVSGGVITGLPGLAIQVVLVPALYHLLARLSGMARAAADGEKAIDRG